MVRVITREATGRWMPQDDRNDRSKFKAAVVLGNGEQAKEHFRPNWLFAQEKLREGSTSNKQPWQAIATERAAR